MFTDDLLVFCHVNGREAMEIQSILRIYTNWSGQLVNHSKSCSPNTHTEVVASIQNILKLKIISGSSKYLGLPFFLGRSKKIAFADVKDKVMKKVAGWKAKTLSQAGCTTLIKAVVITLPQYYMSIFLMPKSWYMSID